MPKGIYPHTHIKPKVYPAELVARVRQLYADGLTQDEVATVVGASQKVIWKLMRNHGIQTRKQAKRYQIGEANHAWKGNAASYQALHLRVEARRGKPARCNRCGTTDPARTYEWANLTGRYHDPEDYERMCRHCHRRYDNARRRGGDAHA
jgi:hypothetical protein